MYIIFDIMLIQMLFYISTIS